MQFQADILGVPVERPPVLEVTALGAALLAGLAVGFWSDRAELESLGAGAQIFEPRLRAERRERLYAGWKRAVERSRNWEVNYRITSYNVCYTKLLRGSTVIYNRTFGTTIYIDECRAVVQI